MVVYILVKQSYGRNFSMNSNSTSLFFCVCAILKYLHKIKCLLLMTLIVIQILIRICFKTYMFYNCIK